MGIQKHHFFLNKNIMIVLDLKNKFYKDIKGNQNMKEITV